MTIAKKYVSLSKLSYFFDKLVNLMDEKLSAKIDKSDINDLTNELLNNCVLLARYDRTGEVETTENYTINLLENINNFMFVFYCTRSNQYIMGSQVVPTNFFKNNSITFELNCMNDQEKGFFGNCKYISDTQVTGKISGNALAFEIYGVGRLATQLL